MCSSKEDKDIIIFTRANFHHLCRICFCEIKPPLINLFSSTFKEESVANLINICIPNQKIDISLPNNICKDCFNLLVQFKTFISQFQYADVLLTFVRDQLNKGGQEIRINNSTKPDISALLNREHKFNIDNSTPSSSSVVKNVEKLPTNIKSKTTTAKQKTTESNSTKIILASQSSRKSTNLTKTKSKSTEHLLCGKPGQKPLLSLPLLLTCNVCKIDFFKKEIFETHMKNTHPNKIIKCTFCIPMQDFFDAEELKRHKIAKHKLVECKKCKSLVAKTNIDKHIEKIHGAPTKIKETQKNLASNEIIDQKGDIANIFAKININHDEIQQQCKLHIIKTEKREQPFISWTDIQCDICRTKFTSQKSFEGHLLICQQRNKIQTQVTVNDKAISCHLCNNETYPSYVEFEQHCTKYHADLTSCNICQTRTLYSKARMQCHRLHCHGLVACEICECRLRPEKIQKHMENCHERIFYNI